MNNGLIIESPPIRGYKFNRVFGSSDTAKYPKYYLLPPDRLGVVKNQGSVACCVAEGISSLAEVFEYLENDRSIEFSEGFAYGAFRDDIQRSSGMLFSKAFEYWRKIGIVPKKYFDSLEEMPEMQRIVSARPDLLEKAKRYKINGYVTLNMGKRKDGEIKKAIFENGYPLIGGSWDYFGESHCILIVGWNDDTDSYIIKNSWGEKWGDNGLKEIPKKEINEAYLITDEVIELDFTDVKKEHWAYGSIKNAYLSGIMTGTTDKTFEPDKAMTRAEMACVIDRLMKAIDEGREF